MTWDITSTGCTELCYSGNTLYFKLEHAICSIKKMLSIDYLQVVLPVQWKRDCAFTMWNHSQKSYTKVCELYIFFTNAGTVWYLVAQCSHQTVQSLILSHGCVPVDNLSCLDYRHYFTIQATPVSLL